MPRIWADYLTDNAQLLLNRFKSNKEDMNDMIEIYIRDLVPDVQQEVLAAMGLKCPEEANLDIFPLFTLEPDEFERNEK